ncbi:MAG: AAA family ATPase [Leadbetterella sp.]|nr:AAA family ATPase [Leadbetterella sp.]
MTVLIFKFITSQFFTQGEYYQLKKQIQNVVNKTLMESIKLSTERQDLIKELWKTFKNGVNEKEKESLKKKIEELIGNWEEYRHKIENDTFELEDYTNTKDNATKGLPGGYLCNFLERTTREILGSSKPGFAKNFEVKRNNDNTGTYHIEKENNPKATYEEAKHFFAEKIKGLIKDIVTETDVEKKANIVDRIVNRGDYAAKQILMKLAVLDNWSDFIFIYSEPWIEELYEDFFGNSGKDKGIFEKNHHICNAVKGLLNVIGEDKIELVLLSRFLLRYITSKNIIDEFNPNVIMYGPPGTGKTYSVRNSLGFICHGDRSRYEYLQFHPSFTYEDFIEGIKPKGVSENGNIRFELVNGVFKKFCIKAKEALIEWEALPKNEKKEMPTYYFIVDEINRANLSTVFGETLSLLEKDYRDDGRGKYLVKTQYSTLIEQLIEDNPHNSEYKKLAYNYDEKSGEVKFGIPKNIFFIGMMNDVDKSIDAFDLALRRRFKWERKDCDYEVIEDNGNYDNINKYIEACKLLNEYISGRDDKNKPVKTETETLTLGKSYEFGHSFFMKINHVANRKEITPDNVEKLFNLFLRPTLKEYLRAFHTERELDDKLEEALNRFKKPLGKNEN